MHLKLVPDIKIVWAGSKAMDNQSETIKKHIGHVRSLTLIRCNLIKELDDIQTYNGSKFSLRSVLMTVMKYPLVPQEGVTQKRLFHLVGKAENGRDAAGGVVYLTA